MALVDSQATFQLHCDKIDPSGWLKRMMAQNQLRTFSDLGFAVGTPQAPASTSEFDTFCNQLNGNVDMSISEVSRVRRLHFEACTLIVAHTKQQVSLDSSVEGNRKLPAAEKQARLQQQQARLSGVNITGELQPSHALIDLAASMLESNTVIWIGPSKCSKRETEIQIAATKEKSQILSVEQQTVRVTAADSTLKVENNTELQLQWSLQRRGIALDQCRLIEWDCASEVGAVPTWTTIKTSPRGVLQNQNGPGHQGRQRAFYDFVRGTSTDWRKVDRYSEPYEHRFPEVGD